MNVVAVEMTLPESLDKRDDMTSCINSNLAVLVDTPSLKPTKTEPRFIKLNSPPTKLCILFYSSPLGHEAMPTNLHPVIAPRWVKLHTFPLATMGGTYKPEKSPFYSILARQLCDNKVHPFSIIALGFSSTRNLSSKSRPATLKCFQITTNGCMPQRDTPPLSTHLLILVAAMGNCEQANGFQ